MLTAMPAPSETRVLGPLLLLKLTGVALFWGGTFVAGRVLTQAMPVLSAAWCRYVVAAVLLVMVAWRSEGGLPRPDRAQLLMTAALGLTGVFLYNLFFFGALARLPAGRTSLFVSLIPIVTALAASLVFRERLGPWRWAGIAVALLGAMVVITRGDLMATIHDVGRSFGSGELLMLGAVVSWAAYTLIARKGSATLTPVVMTTYATVWGLAFLTVGAAPELRGIDWASVGWPTWACVVYIGAFGTVLAFVWFAEGVRAVGPSRTAVFINLVPAFGVTLSAVLLGEPVLASMLVGGVLAALGVSLTNRQVPGAGSSPSAKRRG